MGPWVLLAWVSSTRSGLELGRGSGIGERLDRAVASSLDPTLLSHPDLRTGAWRRYGPDRRRRPRERGSFFGVRPQGSRGAQLDTAHRPSTGDGLFAGSRLTQPCPVLRPAERPAALNAIAAQAPEGGPDATLHTISHSHGVVDGRQALHRQPGGQGAPLLLDLPGAAPGAGTGPGSQRAQAPWPPPKGVGRLDHGLSGGPARGQLNNGQGGGVNDVKLGMGDQDQDRMDGNDNNAVADGNDSNAGVEGRQRRPSQR